MPNPSTLERDREPDPARELAERIWDFFGAYLIAPSRGGDLDWLTDRLREFREAAGTHRKRRNL